MHIVFFYVHEIRCTPRSRSNRKNKHYMNRDEARPRYGVCVDQISEYVMAVLFTGVVSSTISRLCNDHLHQMMHVTLNKGYLSGESSRSKPNSLYP